MPPHEPLTAQAMSLDELLRSGRFRPASVQRDFEWTEEEALQLLRDLQVAFSYSASAEAWGDEEEENDEDGTLENEEPEPIDVYSIGWFCLCRADDGVIEVYDGQQRLVTLTILLAVLRDLVSDSTLADTLHRCIVTAEEEPRLTLQGRDPTLLNRVQLRGQTQRKQDTRAYYATGRRILRIQRHFTRQLSRVNEQYRIEFAAYVLHQVRPIWVEVGTPQLGRQVFVSSNRIGKQLDLVAVLKGQVGDLGRDDDEGTELIAIWDEAREMVGASFEEMLRAFDAVIRRQPQIDSWALDLGDFLIGVEPERAVVHVHRLRSFVEAWQTLMNAEPDGEGTLHTNLWRLHHVGWTEWRPLAVLWLERYLRAERAEDAAVQAECAGFFGRLHGRCMALVLAEESPSRRATLIADAVNQSLEGKDPTRMVGGKLRLYAARRRHIERTLRSDIKDDALWRPLMHWAESLWWRPHLQKHIRRGSVEHLAPRHPSSMAFAEMGAARAARYDRLCYSLGNLAMVPSALNQELGNLPYEEKWPLLVRHGEAYWTLADALAHKTWNEEIVEARQKRIEQRIMAALHGAS